jgi:hypothetical protein
MIKRAFHWAYCSTVELIYMAWEAFKMLALLLTVFALALIPFILLAWAITEIVGAVG